MNLALEKQLNNIKQKIGKEGKVALKVAYFSFLLGTTDGPQTTIRVISEHNQD